MRSIIQDESKGQCFLCVMLDSDTSRKYTEKHHIFFGSANRKLSEKYGLTVRLCVKHHREGPEAVHNNAEIRDKLCQIGQRAFEKRYPDKDFREIFGKNYL